MPYCSSCEQQYYENARFCQNLGSSLGAIATLTTFLPTVVNGTYVVLKRTGVAALLAGLIGLVGLWGIGRIYVGRVARGTVLLIVGLELYRDNHLWGHYYSLYTWIRYKVSVNVCTSCSSLPYGLNRRILRWKIKHYWFHFKTIRM